MVSNEANQWIPWIPQQRSPLSLRLLLHHPTLRPWTINMSWMIIKLTVVPVTKRMILLWNLRPIFTIVQLLSIATTLHLYLIVNYHHIFKCTLLVFNGNKCNIFTVQCMQVRVYIKKSCHIIFAWSDHGLCQFRYSYYLVQPYRQIPRRKIKKNP